jgi:sporulation protein YlmC with PRC-barrel domain
VYAATAPHLWDFSRSNVGDDAIYVGCSALHHPQFNHSQEVFMTTASGHTSAIRAKKVIGTDVKDTSGATIGKVEDIMLDKQSTNIMYAVVGFGGFLGMGEKYHPVPWSQLDYNKADGAYVVPYTKDQLKAAPADSLDALTREDGMAYRDRAYEYYKVKPYWQ